LECILRNTFWPKIFHFSFVLIYFKNTQKRFGRNQVSYNRSSRLIVFRPIYNGIR
jgi:hypothetical protein